MGIGGRSGLRMGLYTFYSKQAHCFCEKTGTNRRVLIKEIVGLIIESTQATLCFLQELIQYKHFFRD